MDPPTTVRTRVLDTFLIEIKNILSERIQISKEVWVPFNFYSVRLTRNFLISIKICQLIRGAPTRWAYRIGSAKLQRAPARDGGRLDRQFSGRHLAGAGIYRRTGHLPSAEG